MVFVANTSHQFNQSDAIRPVLTHSRLGVGVMLRAGSTAKRYKTLPYAALAQAIRTACPDMFFSISLHTVSYKFPAAYMQYVDYFTFQNYGPSIDVNTYNSMVTACGNFRKQGFPDNKIILSAPFQGTPGGSNPGT